MRKLILSMLIALIGVVGFTYTPIYADALPTPGLPETVPLDTPTSGFEKAREDRQSITVGLIPDYGMSLGERIVWLNPVLEAWNNAAGWDMFVQAGMNDTAPDVTFTTDVASACIWWAGGCTTWSTFPTGWYANCFIHLTDFLTYHTLVMHELGHCLGLQDVTTTQGTNYRGIMSYERTDDTTPENPQDIASLELASYRDTSQFEIINNV